MTDMEVDARTALEDKLKSLLGSNGTGASSAMLQSAIDTALDDLSRLKPLVKYFAVNLVPNQQEYAVPETTYNVLDVVFPSYAGASEEQLVSLVEEWEDYLYHSHSMALIDAQKWEQFENLFGYDWEYDIDRNVLIVMPAPQISGKMLVKLSEERTLSTLPKSMAKIVQDLALSEGLRSLATTVGGGITSVPIGIGNVSFNAGTLIAQADAVKASALAKLGTQGGAVIIG